MKSLPLRLVLPLTIISFATLTKWWYALPDDAPDTMYSGFPLPYIGDGWHTSMSYQIFALEFFVDFLIYFLFWYILIYCLNRFVIKIRTRKWITICMWSLSGLIIILATLIFQVSDSYFEMRREYKMKIIETGFKLGWGHKSRPEHK